MRAEDTALRTGGTGALRSAAPRCARASRACPAPAVVLRSGCAEADLRDAGSGGAPGCAALSAGLGPPAAHPRPALQDHADRAGEGGEALLVGAGEGLSAALVQELRDREDAAGAVVDRHAQD